MTINSKLPRFFTRLPAMRIIAPATALLVCLSSCNSPSASKSNASGDLTDLSAPLEDKEFQAPYDPRIGELRLVIAQPSTGLVGSGGQGYNEAVRAQLTQVLSQYRNFRVLDRSVTKEAQAEWQLAAKNAANPKEIPKTEGFSFPNYIVKPTITYVEREIRSDGTQGQWSIAVTLNTEANNTEGAVELVMEVVDVKTLESIITVRSHGLLYDHQRQGSINFGILGGGSSQSVKVPEAQAIRAAEIQGSQQIFQKLREMRAQS